MTVRALAASLCAGLATLAGPAAAAVDPTLALTVDGLHRTYLVHVPATHPAAGYPIVLAFHGGGGTGQGMVGLTHLDPLADRHGFIVAYPNGIDRHWNDGRATIRNKVDDVAFTAAILDDLAHRYPIDAGRIFATGMSNGGMFSERLGCDLAGRIAAIAPVAGTMPADIAPTCKPAQPVSVLQIGGTEDPIMPFDGGAVADFGGLGEGGMVLSDHRTADLWQGLDACPAAAAPATLPPIAPPDGTSVVETKTAPCAAQTAVTLLAVVGGGHTWPDGPQYLPRMIIGRVSHQLDASAAIVDFFLTRPARR